MSQTYADLKEQCSRQGTYFEDPDFPASDTSLFFSGKPPRPFVWKRPHEICSDPQWISEGATRFDIDQGMLGDCWLLAAIASLTCKPKLFNRVMDPSQNFTSEYCGIFKFNIWQQGGWQEVVVDDRLPTYNNKLVFMHSVEKNEFWSALLEKAFAKLCGNYESLKGGQACEAMEDLTGGVTEVFDLGKLPPRFFQQMLQANQRSSLMGCSIDAKPSEIEAKSGQGLVKGHAYSITDVKRVHARTPRGEEEVSLVRVRNPWGNDREWTGAWSDGSPEWNLLSPSEKEALGLSFEHDGEFWMSMEDFCSNFTRLEICSPGPDSLVEPGTRSWECFTGHGNWVKGLTAGGCRNFLNTFAQNPQFRVTLTDVDDEDEHNLCTLVVALMQTERRKQKKMGSKNLTIGYAIYRLKDPSTERLERDDVAYMHSTDRSDNFINSREVVCRHQLEPGTYMVIPSTFDPDEEGDFFVRIFTEKPATVGAADHATRFHRPAHREPSGEDQTIHSAVRKKFEEIAGVDGELDAFELQELLTSVLKHHGSEVELEVARALLANYDVDKTGKIGLEGFSELLKDAMMYMNVFTKYDKDRSLSLTPIELRSALQDVGVTVSNDVIVALTKRFSTRQGRVTCQDFLCCASKLRSLDGIFKNHDDNTGRARFSREDYFRLNLFV